MISVKYAVIMAVGAFAAGSFFAPPVQEAIAAVIATDVQCAGCVGTADLAGNAVTAAKVKDGEIKAAEIASNAVGSSEIATDSVGGSEIIGATKLLFGQCAANSSEGTLNIGAGAGLLVECTISGVDADDSAIASVSNANSSCFAVRLTTTTTNEVGVLLTNDCAATHQFGTGSLIGIIVFDK